MCCCTVALCASLLGFATTFAQERTLAEIAASAKGDVRILITGDGVPPPFSEVVGAADLIVRATIGTGEPRVTDDGESICTDYPLSISQVFFQAKPFTAPRPGTIPVTLRHVGGTVEIRGRKVSVVHSTLPPLESGTEAILMLTRHPDGYFTLARTFFGAFAVQRGRVKPLALTPGQHDEYADLPVEEFVAMAIRRRQAQ